MIRKYINPSSILQNKIIMSDKNNLIEIFLAGVDRVLGYNAVKKFLDESPS